MIQDNLDLPFETTVLGVGVTVDSVGLTGRAASWRSAPEASSGRRSRSSIFRCRRPHQTACRGSTPTATGPTGPRPNPPWPTATNRSQGRHRRHGQQQEGGPPTSIAGLGRRPQAAQALSCAGADGARARAEPEEARRDGHHRQEPWKAPLPQYIEHLYARRFGRERPDVVLSIEEQARQAATKQVERKAAKAAQHRQTAMEMPGE